MKFKIFITALAGVTAPIFCFAALIITQVQTTAGTGKTSWDAIQIYNPDKTPVDLKGYRLVKRTKTGTTDTALKSFASSIVIPQCGYYLWANSDAVLSAEADSKMSGTISDDNGIALRKGDDDVGEIIDNVAWGAATNIYALSGGNPTNPKAGETLQRAKSGANYSGTWEVKAVTDWYNLQTPPSCESEAVVVEAPVATGGLSGGGGSAPIEEVVKVASKASVRINEIVPNPRAEDRGNEYIELYNDSDKEIEMKDWQLKLGEQLQIFTDLKIPAKSFWVLKYPALKITLPNTGKNTAQILNADEENIFKTTYDAGDENLSWSFNGKKWHWSMELTPNTENKIVYPPSAVKAVIDVPVSADLGEIVIFDGSDSWGQTDTENLEYMWTFDDGTTADTMLASHLYLKPGKYHVVLDVARKSDKKKDEAKKTVEIIGALASESKAASAVATGVAIKTASIAKTTAKKVATTKTSSAAVAVASFNITNVRPLAEIRTWKVGSYVSTEGVVAVKNNILGKGVFYVAGSGLRVSAPAYSDELVPGQKIKIYGQLKETLGEKYIAVKSATQIQVVGNVEAPVAHEIALKDIKEGLIGELIKVSGTAGRVSGRYFYMEDGANSLRVYLDDGAFSQVPKVGSGAQVSVTGLLSKTNSGLRLLPREASDIEIKNTPAPAAATTTTARTPWWAWGLIVLAGVIGLEMSREKSFIMGIFKKKN